MTDKQEQPSTSGKLKRYIEYSEFVKNVAAIAAIFLGGCWGLYTFFALQQPQIAEVQARGHSSTNVSFRIASDRSSTFSDNASRELISPFEIGDESNSPSSEAIAAHSVFGSKHTYCCRMGNDGQVSERQQFRAYSWQAPLFCMRMAKSKGYNSGSVSRGDCRPDDEA